VRAVRAGGGAVIAWDDDPERRVQATQDGVPLAEPDEWPWSALDALVVSPGVPLTHPKPHVVVERARAHRIEVIGDIELFMREVRASERVPRIVAITGTNGKSTTAALAAHLLRSAGQAVELGGNIGNPVLGLQGPRTGLVYVLEVSSYQIDLAPSFAPTVAVLLNITPDHLDRHGGLQGYVAVKRKVFANLGKEGVAIVGVDDPHSAGICTSLSSNGAARVVPVSVGKTLSHGAFVIDGVLYDGLATPAVEVVDLKQARALPGAHNWQNAASAYAVGRILNCEPQALAKGIMSFPGLAHRLEEVGRIGRIRFINDSKATNAEAAAKALACLENIYWIAGGRAKEGGFDALRPFLSRVTRAYLIGESASALASALNGTVPHQTMGDLERATVAATRDAFAANGEAVVLLSPASASLDQFRDFEERGERFRALVTKLIQATHEGDAAA
jgi:UDP-N-acetylmuramoylalanine--D-glutamate ligase